MVKKTPNNGRRPNGDFAEGNHFGKGRPKGVKNHDGLQVVLDMLKDLIAEEKNIKTLQTTFQKELDQNPLRFYKTIIMPLLPRNIALAGDVNATIQIILKGIEKLPGQ